ncbi:hypothetical protein C5167_011641, partial [Papaver somniferum]
MQPYYTICEVLTVGDNEWRHIQLWLLDDDGNKKNSTSSWTQVTMELPKTSDGDMNGVYFNPVSGTDQIIINSYAKTSD